MARNEVYEAFEADMKRQDPDRPSKSMYCDVKPIYGGTTSARLLFAFCDLDAIPDNPYVRKDYGFDLVPEQERGMILGLFQGLRMMGITAEDVHRWHSEGRGTLVENIKDTFYAYGPEDVRGSYFKWFLDHQHVLGGEKSSKKGANGTAVLPPCKLTTDHQPRHLKNSKSQCIRSLA